MFYLGLESSTSLASVCVADDLNILSYQTSPHQKGHSEFMNTAILDCLRSASLGLDQVDYFCVSEGPGSFTGLRVAGNIAKSLAYSFSKKLVSTDSLHVLLLQRQLETPWVLCGINAYKNMIYYSLYHHGSRIEGPSVMEASQLKLFLDKNNILECEFVGDGYSAYSGIFSPELKSRLKRPPQPEDYPKASTLVECARTLVKSGQTLDWNFWAPLYIRASSAEENMRK